MSSKFLYSGSSTDLTSLQNGTFDLDAASAKFSDLTPNQPVKTDINKKLISSNLDIIDINGLPEALNNPIFNEGINTLSVSGLENESKIEMSGNTIDLIADNVLVNGVPIGGSSTIESILILDGITTIVPFTNFDVPYTTDPTTLTAPSGINISGGCRITIVAPITLTRIGIPAVHWTSNSDSSPMAFNIYQVVGFSEILYYSSTIARTTLYNGYYVNNLVVPFVLPTAQYVISVAIRANQPFNDQSIAPTIFQHPITFVNAFISSEPNGAINNGTQVGGRFTFAGYIWFETVIPAVFSTPILQNTGHPSLLVKTPFDMNNNAITNCPTLTTLINKTTNIGTTLSTTFTNMTGALNVGPTITTPEYPLTSSYPPLFIAAGTLSRGFRFTAVVPLTLIRIGHAVGAWPNGAVLTSTVNIYLDGNVVALHSFILPRTTVFNGYYVLNITPIVLPIGTYYFSVGLSSGQSLYNTSIIVPPFEFDSTFLTGVRALSAPTGGGAYPTVLDENNYMSAGFLWFNANQNIIMTPRLETNMIQSTGANIIVKNTIDVSSKNIINCATFNGLSPIGGVWLGITDGLIRTNSAAEQDILSGITAVGSLTIPANGFTISAYHMNLSGTFASNNGDILTIRLKAGAVILGSIPLILLGSVGEHFELEGDFAIRTLGGAGVASISVNFDFTYSDGATDAFKGDRIVSVNSTTFNTTISNTLSITAQFNNARTTNSIQVIQGVLTKIY